MLANSARRRQGSFAGRAEALDHLRQRSPYKHLDPEALELYVDHGFERQGSGLAACMCIRSGRCLLAHEGKGAALVSSPEGPMHGFSSLCLSPSLPSPDPSPRGPDGHGWQLRLRKEIEALIFECVGSQGYLGIFERLPQIRCPVAVARGKVTAGAHAMLARSAALIAERIPQVRHHCAMPPIAAGLLGSRAPLLRCRAPWSSSQTTSTWVPWRARGLWRPRSSGDLAPRCSPAAGSDCPSPSFPSPSSQEPAWLQE